MNQQQLDDIKSRVADEYESYVYVNWAGEHSYLSCLDAAMDDVRNLLAEVERLEKENAEHVKYRTYF